jgi:hypothetical protein
MKWLLDSDPAIRWQVMCDLTGEGGSRVASERSRVATEGWGARLLGSQLPDGHWGENDRSGMITVHSLTLLKDFGADPGALPVRKAIARVRKLVWHQFDGGWNCEAPRSQCSSFHSTICVLEGLLEYEKACGRSPVLAKARTRAQDYLLERRMLRSIRTGEVIDRSWTRFQFPPSYHYDVLRGLDYLRSAGVKPDSRVAEAIAVVNARRHQNRLWPLNRTDPRRFTFDMEPGVGKRSHWNTLRALRVLTWHADGTGGTRPLSGAQ